MHESRDERELEVVRSLGYEICVLGRKTEDNRFFKIPVEKAVWKEVNPLAPTIKSTALNRLFCQIPWALEARHMKADVISCHDIAYLFIGWLSTIGLRKKPLLIYDSHEFECERVDRRSGFLRFMIKNMERFLMKRCAFSIMVNDSIADAVQDLHHLKDRPIVVRNIPENWKLNSDAIAENRRLFLQKNNLPQDTFISMYHGVLSEGRGIENSIRAIAETNGTVLIILGNAVSGEKEEYEQLAKECGVKERVFFHEAVPHNELYKYVGMADVGLVMIENACKSYYLSLPNKLFENIQAMTPVIGSDFPEIKRIIADYGVGLCTSPDKPGEIATAIMKMRNDKAFYGNCENNLIRAKEALCWEQERRILEEAYKSIRRTREAYEKK